MSRYPDPDKEQALLDHCAQAMHGFFAGTRGRQRDVRRIGQHRGQVRIPKSGWVKFRWSRLVPGDMKSFRVTRDRAGRLHVAFAHIPDPVPAPGNGQATGIDRRGGVRRPVHRRDAHRARADPG